MKATYTSPCGTVKLWLSDFRKVKIPEDAVVITDPPYNIGKPQQIKNYNQKGVIRESIGQDFGKDFDELALLPSEWVPLMSKMVVTFYGCLRMDRLLTTFRRNGYKVVQDFHWCKTQIPPRLRGIGFSWAVESGYIFLRHGTQGIKRNNTNGKMQPNYFLSSYDNRGKSLKNELHSTRKPVRVMEWLVNKFSLKETLVVDPFMGSGTTGVACVNLGRRFWGMEQKEKYFDQSVRRIEVALKERENSFQFE